MTPGAIRRWACRAALLCGTALPALPVAAQSVVVDGPAAAVLPTITPALTVRATGFTDARPLRVRVQIATAADFAAGAVVVDSTFSTSDTIITVQITRPLPSEAAVYWRGSVLGSTGGTVESAIVGPRTVPAWLTLVTPNSVTGDILDVRRPLFVWRSARVTPLAGAWRYVLEITSGGRPEQAAAGISDTTFRAATDLQANTSYRWSVRASLPSGEASRATSRGSFLIVDPPLPTTTILYQNFPNPFPSESSFNTCFWFDIGEGGGAVSLDVLDLRGNLVRTIVPGDDGVTTFAAGRYGRGALGAGSNCDNRFIWNGTAADGRPVSSGVYLARFRSGTGAPIYRRILFRGR